MWVNTAMISVLTHQLAPVLIITRREMRDQFRDWRIIFPIVVLTVFFPWLMNFTATQALSFVERYGAPIVGERLIPFLLMIVGFFPISVSLVIALESFVGEKERHSIEPLLSSPLSDWQLYLGKLLAAMAPPLLASYLGILVYLVGIVNQVGWRPPPVLLIQMILLSTVQALVMVSGAVVVSSQTTSVRAANLLASFIIIPMALLIQGESIIMFWGNYGVLWWVIVAQVLIAALLVRSGIAQFNREELLGRELDEINLAWGWRTFWKSFWGQATSLPGWYRCEVLPALRSLSIPFMILSACLIIGVWIGIQQARNFAIPQGLLNVSELELGSFEGLDAIQFFSVSGVGTVWLHNLRVLALATILGIFSFGVLAVVVIMLPMGLVGYFMANMANSGLPPLIFLTALVLPHGVLEIPAIALAGASILRLGATLVSPVQGMTIGEAWLKSLADWAKIMIGFVMPMLYGAAMIEVFITPRLAVWLLGG
jgi:uncharacterized membrane protein SpoIIM required for sporulation/ABC-type transport system involved in multi-copper enzyme maturation permease subunit